MDLIRLMTPPALPKTRFSSSPIKRNRTCVPQTLSDTDYTPFDWTAGLPQGAPQLTFISLI
jgi:hypothetical protein